MEAAVLGILILSGIHINNNTTKDNPKIQVDNNHIFKNKSIFNANKVKKSQQHMYKNGIKRTKKSQNPAQSNIIPQIRTTLDSQKRELLEKSKRDNQQYINSLQKFDSLLNQQDKKNEGKYVKEYFENINTANKNNSFFQNSSQYKLDNDVSFETNLMESNGLDSVFRNKKLDSHNNMVPYFGSHITQNTDVNRHSTSKLEVHTGTEQYKTPKREQEAAAPIKDVSYVNGAPVQRDMSNYIPSSYKPFETSVESLHVGPGIDKGYCASGNDGFHNMYQAQYKTIDELRTKSNPHKSYEGVVITGKNRNDNRTRPQQLFKNRPETMHERSSDNNFRTTGAYLKETFQPMVRQTPKKLQGTNEYSGIVRGSTKQNLSYTDTYYTDPTKQEKEHQKPSNLSGPTKSTVPAQDKLRNTVRETTEHNNYTGTLSGTNKSTLHLHDEAKTTTRQTTQYNEHFGHLNGSNKLYASYEDQAKTTIRQTTQFNDHTGQLSGSNKFTAHAQDEFRTTGRQTTEHNDHTGQLSGSNKFTAHAQDEFRTTGRQTTEHNDHTGQLSGSNKFTAHAQDEFRTTGRQTTEHNDHTGTLSGSNKFTAHAQDEFRTTGRQTTEHNDHTGQLSANNKLTAHAQDEFRTTGRQTTQFNDHTGTLSGQQKFTKHLQDELKITTKETTVEYTRDGNIRGYNKHQSGLQDDVRNTQRQGLSDNEYIGIIDGKERETIRLQDEVRPTQKAILSDNEYKGSIKGSSKHKSLLQDEVRKTQKSELSNNDYYGDIKGAIKDRSRLAEENANTNELKEIISQGRLNASQGPKSQLKPELYNLNLYKNQLNQDKIYDMKSISNISKVTNQNQIGEVHANANKIINSTGCRLDPSLYDAYRMNEYTIRKI